MKFVKKPVVIEASQWFRTGDHPQVHDYDPYGENTVPCQHCYKSMCKHGWIITLEGGHIVCPGNWVVKFREGYEILNSSEFAEKYEEDKC